MTDSPKAMSEAHAAPRCHYLKLNGSRCGAPALRGRHLCYFHLRALRRKRDYRLPVLEDAASLQYAIMQILRALEDKHYDIKTCGMMLYGLQIACSNLNRYVASLPQPEEQEDSLAAILLERLTEMQDRWRRDQQDHPEPQRGEGWRKLDPHLSGGPPKPDSKGWPTLSPSVGVGWDHPNLATDPGDHPASPREPGDPAR